MRLNHLIIFIVAVCLAVACGKATKETTTISENQIIEGKKPEIEKARRVESYVSFYKKFHSDSVFQMSRIKFPIEGYYTDQEGIEQKWTKNSWIMHRSYIQNADTSIYTLEISDAQSKKEELLYIEGGGFKVERKFKQINGKWYLVYYVDENL